MKCLLYVCLITSLTVAGVHAIEQSVEASQASATAQVLQKGVSVKMAGANNAQPMPDADNADAWIITVTADGRLYFGVDPVTPADLQQRMIRTPRKRSQRLYIKADARASFASVQKALDAASTAEFASPVLLVSQEGTVSPGTVVSPKGLEILMDGPANSGAKSVVELNYSAQGSPTVRLDDQEIPFAALRDRLNQVVQSKKEKAVLLRADRRSSFGDVARVVDACRAEGLTVVVATPVV
jgi:biopolymer transport protein ExbD